MAKTRGDSHREYIEKYWLSSNKVPVNPMLNHQFPLQYGHLEGISMYISHFQTHPNIMLAYVGICWHMSATHCTKYPNDRYKSHKFVHKLISGWSHLKCG
jgi:hypothetical protein